MILSGNLPLDCSYAIKACWKETTNPCTNSSLGLWTTALLYHLVYVSLVDATKAETECAFLSGYESMPIIMAFFNGILMDHNVPPILQFICNAIFWTIDRFLVSLLNVRALITWRNDNKTIDRLMISNQQTYFFCCSFVPVMESVIQRSKSVWLYCIDHRGSLGKCTQRFVFPHSAPDAMSVRMSHFGHCPRQ